MDIQVLIERVEGAGYRVSAFGLTAEGANRESAIEQWQQLLAERMARGATIETICVPAVPPFLKYVGTWKADDPVIEEWLQIIEENRQQADRDMEAK